MSRSTRHLEPIDDASTATGTRLRGLGAEATMTDPEAIANARRIHPQLTNVEERATAGTASTGRVARSGVGYYGMGRP